MKGRMRYRQKQQDGSWGGWSKYYDNLFVDDGKELTLDFLFGLMSWWNPKDQGDYVGGDSGWDTIRYVEIGESMFNNKSAERGSGIKGIESDEFNYQIQDTFLVSPEDSFLSNPVGSRVVLNAIRYDQRVEFRARFDAPGDVPTGTSIREIAIFLRGAGPVHDPSQHNASKPYSMICRSTRFGTGYFDEYGVEGNQGDPGVEPCYTDDPLVVIDDLEIEWEFGSI